MFGGEKSCFTRLIHCLPFWHIKFGKQQCNYSEEIHDPKIILITVSNYQSLLNIVCKQNCSRSTESIGMMIHRKNQQNIFNFPKQTSQTNSLFPVNCCSHPLHALTHTISWTAIISELADCRYSRSSVYVRNTMYTLYIHPRQCPQKGKKHLTS